MQAKSRPININPLSIKLPITAIASIMHRLSGIFVFLLIPCLLWSLQTSLHSKESIWAVRDFFSSLAAQIVLWLVVSAFVFHLLAGVKHLLMDVHIGDSKKGGRWGSWTVILLSAAFAIYYARILWY